MAEPDFQQNVAAALASALTQLDVRDCLDDDPLCTGKEDGGFGGLRGS